ncbi:DUF3089 domain-containing protein [Comamonas sp. NLF-1-9]|uniref:DUF3089 domain-containing protein n=1 Tax=Comamonas sp. NLF-1-9 TaxID=2853163 RepID=UPI001C473F11|nr:DUF3089 domain-containing protein [Comamonas sp. NLF-1-9]QXL83168.1 DUF3089 domain-containing protein [Comamonas sp. NLF-1-9]
MVALIWVNFRCAAIGLAFALFCGVALHAQDLAPLDYARDDAWLALPGKTSVASRVPAGSGFSNLQGVAKADVFYIHPTTSVSRKDVLNTPIDDPEVVEMDAIMLMTQATPFNGIARVYAPRYRQTALHVYFLSEEEQQVPSNRAYADVKAAFEFYVRNHNHGRPFFLVGHSQGANHAQRLLSEVIQGQPIQERLVAAYIPGIPLPRSVFRDDLRQIPPCHQPAQIGCAAVWGSFGMGGGDDLMEWSDVVHWDAAGQRWTARHGAQMENINPVSWSKRQPRTPASAHRGAAPFGKTRTTFFTNPLAGLVNVSDERGYAFVSPLLPKELFDDGGLFGGENYHVFDISLFWVDIRENARLRLNTFLRQRDDVQVPLIGPTAALAVERGKPVRWRVRTATRASRFWADGLPQGLRLNQQTGVLEGKAHAPGTYAVLLHARNARGTDTAELSLTVR